VGKSKARAVTSNPGVTVRGLAANGKLAPVRHDPQPNGRYRPVPTGPFVAATYASIQGTCPKSCKFKDGGGCFAESGITGKTVKQLDVEAVMYSSIELAYIEAKAIDRLYRRGRVPQDGGRDGKQGRDLRLHVSGDCTTNTAALLLSKAAERWKERGGGIVWAYTHAWREVERWAWGSIQVLASCETAQDVAEARERGYVPALVVREFLEPRAHRLDGFGDTKLIPCPAETRNTTCVQCRLCFDTSKLYERNVMIGFAVHGRDESKAKRKLPVLNTLFGTID
jgi:hypothetical protein